MAVNCWKNDNGNNNNNNDCTWDLIWSMTPLYIICIYMNITKTAGTQFISFSRRSKWLEWRMKRMQGGRTLKLFLSWQFCVVLSLFFAAAAVAAATHIERIKWQQKLFDMNELNALCPPCTSMCLFKIFLWMHIFIQKVSGAVFFYQAILCKKNTLQYWYW